MPAVPERDDELVEIVPLPEFEIDDVPLMQPVGFVWFGKPRYRVKAGSRRVSNA